MNHLPIIGLAGRMSCGKDTAAAYLSRHGYQKTSFAAALREEVSEALQSGAVPEEANWEIRLAFGSVKPPDVYAKPTNENMRKLLQWWGTEYRRSQDPDYWVGRLSRSIDLSRDWVISDVRFENEAKFIRACGGEVWRIDRTFPQNNGFKVGSSEQGFRGHASERITFQTDRVIVNDGGLDAFGKRLSEAYYLARAV